MSRVEFEVSYDYHDGFQWCAIVIIDGTMLKGWGESLERAAQDLERQLKEQR